MRKEEAMRLKETYPKGCQIELREMNGESQLGQGFKGTVVRVEDGKIHVNWENGSNLVLNADKDIFCIRRIPVQEEADTLLDAYCKRVFDVMTHTDLKYLHQSCNGENKEYAKHVLLQLHKEFEQVYGTGYVDSELDFVMMPAVLRGRDSGKLALGLVKLDLESAGEHWGSVWLTEKGIIDDTGKKTPEQSKYLSENFLPYDYWYTPSVEVDYHVTFSEMPEEAAEIYRSVNRGQEIGDTQNIEMDFKL